MSLDENINLGNVVNEESEKYLAIQRTKEVAESIKNKGFGLTTEYGVKPNGFDMIRYESGSFGIIEFGKGIETIQKKYLCGLFTRDVEIPARNKFLASLYVDDEGLDVYFKSEWKLFVNGRENLTKLTQLANELSELYLVKINIHIDSEETEFEES